MNKKNHKKGQVWVETVIYTLIAFSLIAAVLAFVKPKIDELQDKAVIEQSIGLMKDLDSKVREVIQGGSGNKRILDVSIKEGSLIIDGINDEIVFEMESKYVYSELGEVISEGNLLIKTEKKMGSNMVTINRSYVADKFNVTYNLEDKLKTLTKASTSYKISIINRGKIGDAPETEKWNIDVELG
jgi:hypothetical protein